MFLSRVELSPSASARPEFWRELSKPYGAHQALWSLLSRSPEQKRDFLFRSEEGRGVPSFLVLSAEQPVATDGTVWRIESRPFAPVLRPGQRLRFKLRANPVIRRSARIDGKAVGRSHRHDVVMDLARRLEADGQPRPEAALLLRDAGIAWLRRQGERAGFRLFEPVQERIGDDGLLEEGGVEAAVEVRVDGYRQHQVRRKGEAAIRFSTLDFEGVLEVVDPATLVSAVVRGVGPQKAFGCGLMLLRRS